MSARSPEGTLGDLLLRARDAGRWLIFPSEPRQSDRSTSLSFAEVLERSQTHARSLRALGAGVGRTCVLVFDNDADSVVGFFAAQFAGMVAVPWAPPHFTERERAYSVRLSEVAQHCAAQFVLSTRAFVARVAPDYAGPAPLIALEELPLPVPTAADDTLPCQNPASIAVVQYTSGSTGAPKAVELTHAAITANLRSIGEAIGVSSVDVGLCWLPMFHDMGLFGSLIFSLFWKIPLVLMSPRTFLLRPDSWLWAMSRFSATLCAAPNYAYQTCVSRIRADTLTGLDLSSWRVAFNGSESVQYATVRAFSERFACHGFAPSAMYPAYGLAENVVAACLPRQGEQPFFDWIERGALAQFERAVPCAPNQPGALAVARVGRPLAAHGVRIVRDGRLLAERCVGEIELMGPSTMLGYHRAEQATLDVVTSDRWLRSGDLGYLANGELYVLGRRKNVIKRGGESYHAADIEAELTQIEGISAGYLAVCGQFSTTSGTEEVVVLMESRDERRRADESLKRTIAGRVRERFGVTPERVIFLRKGRLPRTTSGKVRHSVCRQMLEKGELDDE